jgi:hypothetical protein
MDQQLLLVGIVLLAVVLWVVPMVISDVVPPVVERVVRGVERVGATLVSRLVRPQSLGADRLDRLEAQLATLTASVNQLAAAESALLQRVIDSPRGASRGLTSNE